MVVGVVGVVATVEVVLVSVSFVIAVSVRATVDGAHAAAAVAIILLETVAADLFVADDVYREKDWPFLPSSIAFCSHSASAILRLSPYFLRFQWPFALRQSRTFGLCVWWSFDFGDVGGRRTWKKVYSWCRWARGTWAV